MSSDRFVVGGEAAILPSARALPQDVVEIGVVQYVGAVFIRLVDGRMFATIGGRCLSDATGYHVVPVDDAHRDALKGR